MFNIFGKRPPAETAPRIHLETQPAVIYAIGDIHGCLDKLKALEAFIAEDAASIDGEKLIITLGDYIDRGPASAQTLNHLIRRAPEGFKRICLQGNHEVMFQKAVEQPKSMGDWLEWGGRETLTSYGIDGDAFRSMSVRTRGQVMQSFIPVDHLDFLKSRPIMVTAGAFTFVHAGIRPKVALEQQRDEDLIWIREPFLSQPHGLPATVVHGHTPMDAPSVAEGRIGIDTGAYAGGPLTAVKILKSGAVSFMSTTAPKPAT
ncbi:hypothetical protein ASG47_09720 [Devosia sp. Leaf420]|uniref:metallophosphoesterase family protein n=1 Tax=Devosia sp. Leaf420 TaxID=1736374 RepID=UPI000712DB8C|nr:metallophosphoesterase family protein [Devosia sp. Leaf420]KQT46887.1 hypothetical protein ASG47_09720 [Devosia sp. Leaf420]